MFHQVAIAYLMQKAPYVFPIIGGRKVEHLMANLEALEITLSDDHIKYLESVEPFDPGFPYTVIVSCLFFFSSSLYPWSFDDSLFVFLRRVMAKRMLPCSAPVPQSSKGPYFNPSVLEIYLEQQLERRVR